MIASDIFRYAALLMLLILAGCQVASGPSTYHGPTTADVGTAGGAGGGGGGGGAGAGGM